MPRRRRARPESGRAPAARSWRLRRSGVSCGCKRCRRRCCRPRSAPRRPLRSGRARSRLWIWHTTRRILRARKVPERLGGMLEQAVGPCRCARGQRGRQADRAQLPPLSVRADGASAPDSDGCAPPCARLPALTAGRRVRPLRRYPVACRLAPERCSVQCGQPRAAVCGGGRAARCGRRADRRGARCRCSRTLASTMASAVTMS